MMKETDRREIYAKIKEARDALKQHHADAATAQTQLKPNTEADYLKVAKRLYGLNSEETIAPPRDPDAIIQKIRASKKASTLRKYARAVRHVALLELTRMLKMLDQVQRDNRYDLVKKVVMQPEFDGYIKLASWLPENYKKNWKPQKKRKSKKVSLKKLPVNWREQMAENSSGQYHIPMLIIIATGCRPAEVQNGVQLKVIDGTLYAEINGAKVTERSGQEKRILKLPENTITEALKNYVLENDGKITVQVDKPNSVSTHMRSIGMKLWPKMKESITAYTARHAMAADCKDSEQSESVPDFVSKVLGHQADDTKSYYGTSSQSKSKAFVPVSVVVTTSIKHKIKSQIFNNNNNNNNNKNRKS